MCLSNFLNLPHLQYLYGSHAIFFVYDVTVSSSLDGLTEWVAAARKAARAQERPPIFALVANKADLEHARQVSVHTHTHTFICTPSHVLLLHTSSHVFIQSPTHACIHSHHHHTHTHTNTPPCLHSDNHHHITHRQTQLKYNLQISNIMFSY